MILGQGSSFTGKQACFQSLYQSASSYSKTPDLGGSLWNEAEWSPHMWALAINTLLKHDGSPVLWINIDLSGVLFLQKKKKKIHGIWKESNIAYS